MVKKIVTHSWWILSLAGIMCIVLLIQGGAFSAAKIPTRIEPTVIMENPEPLAISESPHYEPLVTPESFSSLESAPTPSFLPLRGIAQREKSATATSPVLPTFTTTSTPIPTPIADFHIVQKGEILASIAAKYGMTTESLLLANNLAKSTDLRVGQRLIIPSDPSKITTIHYTVKNDDTLLSIAAKYNSSVENILHVNPNLTDKSLSPGQVLTVPVVFSQQPTPQIAQMATAVHHIVKSGEAPLSIAYQYNIPVEVLLAVNDITDPMLLQVGRELIIPPPDGLTLGVPVILHEMEKGETLIGLVSKYGSSVRDVLVTNPDLVPDSLKEGQVVAIPVVFPQPLPTRRPSNRPAPRSPAPPSAPGLAAQMVQAINVERAAHKLSALKSDDGIAMMAVAHAQDMVVRGFFAHVNPDGQTVRDRFVARKISKSFYVGENIQRNNQPSDKTVEVALAWFMGSPPHRNNILHQHYTRVGVGIVKGAGDTYTIVLDFSE